MVEATNAWRIRRIRGDIGLRRRLVAAARVAAFPLFVLPEAVALLAALLFAAAVCLPLAFEGGDEDFVAPDEPA